MLVHKVNTRGGSRYGYFTPTKRLPNPSDGYVDSSQAARSLGTTKDVVHALADDGHLPAEDDSADANRKWINIDDLRAFIQKALTPVDVSLVELPPNGAPAATGARSVPPTRTNPVATRNGKPAAPPSPPAAADDDDDSYDLVADCPACGSRFGVDAGVLRCKCPSCGSILDVDQEPEEPETAAKPTATNPGLLARLFGYHGARPRG